MQLCNERMRRSSARPRPQPVINDYSMPIRIYNWVDWAKEHKRRIRRVVFLMRQERSMRLFFEVLRILSEHLKVNKPSRIPKNPAYSGGDGSISLSITMGRGISRRILRDFPCAVATARSELRYSHMMVREHHLLLPYQPLLERVWFVRPHVRAFAAVEDAMASHRGPPSRKQPFAQCRTPEPTRKRRR